MYICISCTCYNKILRKCIDGCGCSSYRITEINAVMLVRVLSWRTEVKPLSLTGWSWFLHSSSCPGPCGKVLDNVMSGDAFSFKFWIDIIVRFPAPAGNSGKSLITWFQLSVYLVSMDIKLFPFIYPWIHFWLCCFTVAYICETVYLLALHCSSDAKVLSLVTDR